MAQQVVGDRLLRAISPPGPTPHRGPLVLALPAAGAGPSIFRKWLPHLPADHELVAVTAPGREDRCLEPVVSTAAPLADDIAASLDRYGDRPVVIFGHSAGALLGFEVARRLESAGRPLLRFVAAGATAPDVPLEAGSLADADDETLIDALRGWGGTPEEMLTEDVLELVLPCMRADMAVADSCRRPEPPSAEERLRAPVVALSGAQDGAVDVAGCRRWSAWTAGGFAAHLIPGGHFFPFEQSAAVVAHVTSSG